MTILFLLVLAAARSSVQQTDGSLCWRHPMRSRVDASPVAVRVIERHVCRAPCGSVLVADAAGDIKILRDHDGKPYWEFDAGGGFSGSPAVVRNRVVLASDDGVVWCFAHEYPQRNQDCFQSCCVSLTSLLRRQSWHGNSQTHTSLPWIPSNHS